MSTLKSVFAATAFAFASPLVAAQVSDVVDTSEDVVLIADSLFENEAENTVIAEGNVQASYQGRILKADKVIYNRSTNKVRAIGNVVILDPDGSERFSDEVEVSSNLSDGYAIGFAMRLPNGGQAVANSAIRQENGLNSLDQVVYTACEVCDVDDRPTWALRARRAVLDEEDQMISYRDAVLEVGGVPVFYLPYFAHPDPQSERRSGFLFPDVGVSSKFGAFYQQPYYVALSDSSELIVSPEVSQKVNPLLELEYKKRFWSGDLSIHVSGTYEAEFDNDGEFTEGSEESARSHIFANGIFAINNTWDWGFGLERASDELYTARYGIDGERDIRGLYANQPRRLLSQFFVTGQSDDFYSETAVLSTQGLRLADDDGEFGLIAPLHFTERLFDLDGFGLASVQASAAALTRDTGADSQRVSVGADWSHKTILPGGLVLEPFADARADYYALDEDVSGTDSVSRTLATGGARLSYPLIRRGSSFDVMVEPIVMGAWGVSDANDPAIPIEDSIEFEADYSNLFDASATSGFDLYEGNGRAAAGIRTTARWTNGVELSGTAGMRWRSEADEAFNTRSNLDGTRSDFVANVAADLGRGLRLETNMRLDDKSFEVQRLDASVSSNFWRVTSAVRYFNLDESITANGEAQQGITAAGRFRLTDRFSLTFANERDIERDFNRVQTFGLRYTDDCSVFSIFYDRNNRFGSDLGASESVRFQFTLRTLGQFGSSDVD
ncbi:MAG: LPS assembly protein LptD [Pseudomonadota bacterium]